MAYQNDCSDVKYKGMRKFIHIFIVNILSFIYLNILFIICSLPIVTIPTANIALTKAMQNMVMDNEKHSPFISFMLSFKQNIESGILITITYGTIIACCITTIMFYHNNADTNISFAFLQAASSIILFIVFLSVLMVVQIEAAINIKFIDAVKNSFILIIMAPMKIIAIAVLWIVVVSTALLRFPFSVPVLLMIVFSLSNYIIVFAMSETIYNNCVKWKENL